MKKAFTLEYYLEVRLQSLLSLDPILGTQNLQGLRIKLNNQESSQGLTREADKSNELVVCLVFNEFNVQNNKTSLILFLPLSEKSKDGSVVLFMVLPGCKLTKHCDSKQCSQFFSKSPKWHKLGTCGALWLL